MDIGYAEVITVILLILGGWWYFTRDPRRAHIPPHVRGWPLINQTLLQAKDNPIPYVQKWAKQYGELFCTTSGSTLFVWVSGRKAFKELIDRRSAIYSSKPPAPMAQRASGGKRVTFMQYGREWRALRNILHRLLTPAMSKSYSPIQEYEAKQFTNDLLDRPQDFYMHNRRYAASVIMQVTYGHAIPVWDCEEIRQIYGILSRFATFRRPGAYLIDVFPELESWAFYDWLSGWKKTADYIHREDTKVFTHFWNKMRREIDEGTAPHSWGKLFVQSDYQKHGVDDLAAIYAAGAMIEAGSETTSQALNNTIVGLLSNPDAVTACHEELDRVVGEDRTPTFEDIPNLPYIRALVKETMRWRPTTKLGMNHYVIEDNWYDGYFIPKDSVVILNQWALHYDEEMFPEPEKYRPERFLHHDLTAGEYAALADVYARDHFGFGGGRRICPGLHIAERSIVINLARLLWGFNIEHARENGKIVPVDFTTDGLVPGAMSNAKPFKCSITPRGEKRERIMREEWAQAQKTGVDFSHIKFEVA